MRTMMVLLLCAIGVAAQEEMPTLRDGALIAVRLNHSIHAERVHAGEAVEATLIAPVVSHGVVIVPSNAVVVGHVLAAEGRRKGVASRLLIRFEQLRWRQQAVALNAYMVRQLLVRRTITQARGNDPCPIARFDFQRRERDAAIPQVPRPQPMPCDGRFGTSAVATSDRSVFFSPPLKNMNLHHLGDPPGAVELISQKKNIKLSRSTMLELRHSAP